MILTLKKDLMIPRGTDESMGYSLFKAGKTTIGFEFQQVIPGRKSIESGKAKLYDASDNLIMDASDSHVQVTRNVVKINGKEVPDVTFDDIYNFTSKGIAVLKTFKVNETQTLNDFI